jgi:hypothetical protein
MFDQVRSFWSVQVDDVEQAEARRGIARPTIHGLEHEGVSQMRNCKRV